tara:strand:+ start:3886 stop:4227 length:342 start_codon:yes stop_codon:yes gene_type:complete
MLEQIGVEMMIGRLAYADTDYENTVAIDQCKRGVRRLGLTWEAILSRSRKRKLVDARRLCCVLLRERGWTYDMIADAVGYTNHATAIHHVKTAEQLLIYDSEFNRKSIQFNQV